SGLQLRDPKTFPVSRGKPRSPARRSSKAHWATSIAGCPRSFRGAITIYSSARSSRATSVKTASRFCTTPANIIAWRTIEHGGEMLLGRRPGGRERAGGDGTVRRQPAEARGNPPFCQRRRAGRRDAPLGRPAALERNPIGARQGGAVVRERRDLGRR